MNNSKKSIIAGIAICAASTSVSASQSSDTSLEVLKGSELQSISENKEVKRAPITKPSELANDPNMPKKKRHTYIASLKFQVAQLKEAEDKWKAERASLQLTAQNYEILHKKYTE